MKSSLLEIPERMYCCSLVALLETAFEVVCLVGTLSFFHVLNSAIVRMVQRQREQIEGAAGAAEDAGAQRLRQGPSKPFMTKLTNTSLLRGATSSSNFCRGRNSTEYSYLHVRSVGLSLMLKRNNATYMVYSSLKGLDHYRRYAKLDKTSRCDFIFCAVVGFQSRDFTGAVALLEFNRRSGEDDTLEDTLMWLGYCSFHLGNYQRAIDVYQVQC